MNWNRFLRHFAGWTSYSLVAEFIVTMVTFWDVPYGPSLACFTFNIFFAVLIGFIGACISGTEKEDEE